MSSSNRTTLTRQQIIEAAMEVIQRDGLEGLSIRKVAAAADSKPMSLYRHIADKDDLLDALIDQVYAGLATPPAGTPWRHALRTMAMAERDALIQHPWVCALLAARFPGPERRRHMDTLLRILASADLPEDLADLAYHALAIHVHGFALQQVGYEGAAEQFSQDARSFLRDTPKGQTPDLVAHLHYHANRHHEIDDFTFVLDLLLDGIERAALP